MCRKEVLLRRYTPSYHISMVLILLRISSKDLHASQATSQVKNLSENEVNVDRYNISDDHFQHINVYLL
jgi:hypothetical protein